jgi:peptidoglycan/LPS O-acetylase OafA/YrhL
LAIAGVLAIHYRPPQRPALNFLEIGWVGVDLFFVLSGFLITTNLVSLRGTTHPYRVFYWRRMLRIFPPYYAVLLTLIACEPRMLRFEKATIVQAALFLTSVTFRESAQQLLHVLSGGALITARAPIGDHIFNDFMNGLGIFWSLSVEEIYYLVWAPIILQCTRRQVFAISLAGVCAAPVLRVLGHTAGHAEYFDFFFHFDTLLIGSLLALMLVASRRGMVADRKLKRGLSAVAAGSLPCLIALWLGGGFLRGVEPMSGLTFAAVGYTLLGLFFGAIVGLCVVNSESGLWWAVVLRSRPMVFVGTISYMMYLIHVPVWVVVYRISLKMGAAHNPSLWIGLLSTIGTVALASLSWRFFEQPILRFKDAIFSVPEGAKVERSVALR